MSKTKLARMHEAFRSVTRKEGWFEEDCEWSLVALTFPELFEKKDVDAAHFTAKEYFPDAYQAWRQEFEPGYQVPIEESYVLRKREFERVNANNWVVISAVNAENGMVRCIATLGGKRDWTFNKATKERTFLVPKEEYTYNFVIDTARHVEVF